MKFDLLINIFDAHNEASIILTEKYKPKDILFFYINNKEVKHLEKLKKYYSQKFPRCSFRYEKLEIYKPEKIESVITSYEGCEAVCNLTSGNKVVTLMVYTFCLKHNIDCRYVDIKKEKLIDFTHNGIYQSNDNFVDLNIEDIIKSVGGSIIVDSTELYNDVAIEEMTKWIGSNQEKWEKLKIQLQDTNIIIRDESNPDFIRINKNSLDDIDVLFFKKALAFLTKRRQISLKEDDSFFKIYFLNDFIKSFIFKSGTWLEVLTKDVVNEIEVIDDVKSGVLFLWNNERTNVKNELDVLAIKDSVLICISCKDSKKYDEVALNELNVYATQLGGENAVKILVATREPMKTTVSHRAKEMNINIVVFDGDIDKFRKNIKNIISLI